MEEGYWGRFNCYIKIEFFLHKKKISKLNQMRFKNQGISTHKSIMSPNDQMTPPHNEKMLRVNSQNKRQ